MTKFSALWLLLVAVSLSVFFAPLMLLLTLAWPASGGLAVAALVVGLPLALFAGFLLLMGLATIYGRCFENTPNGHFRMFRDRGARLWAFNNAVPTLYMRWFQSTVFLNDDLRHLMLRAFKCDVDRTASIPSSALLGEFCNLHIGARSVIGEYAVLTAASQLKPKLLVVRDIHIGEDVLVGGRSALMGGVHIGDRTRLGADVFVSIQSQIGSDCAIGLATQIDSRCKIGNNVKIGAFTVILAGTVIGDDAVIEAGATVGGTIAPGEVVAAHATSQTAPARRTSLPRTTQADFGKVPA